MTDYTNLFSNLPEDANVWIYAADRRLIESEAERLAQLLDTFSLEWSSHGRMVSSRYSIQEEQLVLIAAFVENGDLSGCGIDKSLHVLNKVADTCEFRWVGPLQIPYRDSSQNLCFASRSEFGDLANRGIVTRETVVVDMSVRDLKTIRQGKLELRAGDTWHDRVFSLSETPIVAP